MRKYYRRQRKDKDISENLSMHLNHSDDDVFQGGGFDEFSFNHSQEVPLDNVSESSSIMVHTSRRQSARQKGKNLLVFVINIFYSITVIIPKISAVEVRFDTKLQDKIRKRAPKVTLLKPWVFVKSMGVFYSRIANHYKDRRPGKDEDKDSNMCAFRLFYTLVSKVFIKISISLFIVLSI